MPRSRKLKIKIGDADSLQSLVQEVYNNACNQITESQNVINKLESAAEPQDVDDHTKIAKAKTDALKLKDSAIKVKLDIGKLQNEIIKHNGDELKAVDANPEAISHDAMAQVREYMALKRKQQNEG